jgi:HSP20 family protein
MAAARKNPFDPQLLFGQRVSLRAAYFTLSGQLWKPATDIVETADAFILRLEIAGVPEEAVSITADNDRLIVRGRRSEGGREAVVRYHTLELQYGSFEKVFRFPFSVGAKDVRATYRDGLLEIEVPKKSAASEPVLIEILDVP